MWKLWIGRTASCMLTISAQNKQACSDSFTPLWAQRGIQSGAPSSDRTALCTFIRTPTSLTDQKITRNQNADVCATSLQKTRETTPAFPCPSETALVRLLLERIWLRLSHELSWVHQLPPSILPPSPRFPFNALFLKLIRAN